jgi:hypothetical protein
MFYLKRDGGLKFSASAEVDIWRWLHRNHSFSVDHALKWEGYTIEHCDDCKPVGPAPGIVHLCEGCSAKGSL